MIREIDWHNSNFINDRNIKFRLKDIFSDHWDSFIEAYSNLDIRSVIHKEVKKMISCRTSELGYSIYECPDCGEIKFSYHTYGRDMKWNPHIHTIVTEGAMGKNNAFKEFDFISYDALRKKFQKILLNLLEKEIGKKEFRTLKNFIYKKSNKGFYVYAEKKYSSSTEAMIEYAVRYTGKPAMAKSRIIDYDGEFITFWYQRHEDNKLVEEKIHVFEFFKRLIIHIPNENFKTVRYYGIYSKKHKFHDKMIMIIKYQTHKLRDSLNSWRMMILKDFDIDPISCPKWGNQMIWQYRVC